MPTFVEIVMSDPAKLAREIASDVMAGEGEIADAIRRAIHLAVRGERAECQRLAAEYGGRDAEEIAELIGKRNFNQ